MSSPKKKKHFYSVILPFKGNILPLIYISTFLFIFLTSCSAPLKKESGRETIEDKRIELMTGIQTAKMEGDLRRERKLCRKFLTLFPEDTETRRIMKLLINADIALKVYSEAEELIDSLLVDASHDEMSYLLLIKSTVKEQIGEYFEASSLALSALREDTEISEEVEQRLTRLAPLLSDNERRDLIGEFGDLREVYILVEECIRYASDIGDTASVRELSGILQGIKEAKPVQHAPFSSKKVYRVSEPRKFEPKKAIKVGFMCPLSGRLATIGHEFLKGALIAMREADAIKNLRLELYVSDTKGDPLISMKEAEKLIEQENVEVIVGAVLSSTTISAAKSASEKGVPFVSPVATEEGIDEISDIVFQLETGTDVEVSALAWVAVKELGLRRMASLAVADYRSFKIIRLFSEEVERLGGRIVATEFYDEGTTDFKDYIEKLRNSCPDGLFVPSDPEDLILILPQLSFYEFGVRLLGLSNWNSQRLFRMIVKDMEGAVFPADVIYEMRAESLKSAALSVNIPVAEVNTFVLGGYQGIKTLVDAISASARSGNIIQALEDYLKRREDLFISIRSGPSGIPVYMVLDGNKVVYKVIKEG